MKNVLMVLADSHVWLTFDDILLRTGLELSELESILRILINFRAIQLRFENGTDWFNEIRQCVFALNDVVNSN